MKVMCIHKGGWSSTPGFENRKKPAFGEECTVVEQSILFGVSYYAFAEYTADDFFRAKFFVQIDTGIEEEVITKEDLIPAF